MAVFGFYDAGAGDPTAGSYVVEIGLVSMVLGWSMWKGKGWSWNLFLIYTVVGIVISPISVLSSGLIGAVFTVIIILVEFLFIYYITRSHVMTYFGKKSIREEFL